MDLIRSPYGVAPDSDKREHRLGEVVLADGRFLGGTSKLRSRTIFRPAFSNWRTRIENVDEFVTVIKELGAGLLEQAEHGTLE